MQDHEERKVNDLPRARAESMRWRRARPEPTEIASCGRSRRGLRQGLVVGEQVEQRALDRGLPRRRVDLRTEQVGDVKHVAGALAEGRDMGGGDVEVEFRNRGGQLI